LSRAIPLVPDAEIKAALLEAAGMIRNLKIILDAQAAALHSSKPK
jgi:hypothetical protein